MGRLTHTVSGSIASIRTPSRVPIESLKLHFLPKQASGTPSPDNPIPIEGWTGLNGRRAGKNLLDKSNVINGYFATSGENVIIYGSNSGRTVWMPCKPNTTYTCHKMSGGQRFSIYCCEDVPANNVVVTLPSGGSGNTDVRKVITNATAKYLCMFVWLSTVDTEISAEDMINSVMVEYGDVTPSEYEPYSGEQIPIAFPATKNLLDATKYGRRDGGTGFTASEGSWSFTQVNGGNSCLVWGTQEFQAGTYTLNAKCFGDSVSGFRLLCSSSSCGGAYLAYYGGYYINSSDGNSKITFTVTEPFTIGIVLLSNSSHEREPGGVSNIQLELGSVSTSYEAYGTIYGGYVDPVAGEIVAEYAMFETTWGSGSTGTVLGDTRRRGFYAPSIIFADAIDLHNNGQGPYGKYRRTLCNVVPWGWDYYSDYPHYYINNHDINIMMPVDTSDDTVIQFCAWLKTPIHIPISSQDMKAFLDHNNFWSDANDVTEVTYPVTESRDILATRKRIMSQTWDMIPLKYQPVEYISAKDSNPYIDMGIQFTSELEAEVHYYNDKGEAFLFGARKGSSNTPYCNFNVESAGSSSAGRSRFDYGNKKAVGTSGLPFAGCHDGEFIFKFHSRTASLKNVSTGETIEKDYSEASYVSYPNYNLFLFSVNTNGTPSLNTGTGELRVYSAKFWLGGQLVRDLVPCVRKSDSKPGMYDRVSKTFFINVGSDEFAIPT